MNSQDLKAFVKPIKGPPTKDQWRMIKWMIDRLEDQWPYVVYTYPPSIPSFEPSPKPPPYEVTCGGDTAQWSTINDLRCWEVTSGVG